MRGSTKSARSGLRGKDIAPVWKRVLVKLKLGRWAIWCVEEW